MADRFASRCPPTRHTKPRLAEVERRPSLRAHRTPSATPGSVEQPSPSARRPCRGVSGSLYQRPDGTAAASRPSPRWPGGRADPGFFAGGAHRSTLSRRLTRTRPARSVPWRACSRRWLEAQRAVVAPSTRDDRAGGRPRLPIALLVSRTRPRLVSSAPLLDTVALVQLGLEAGSARDRGPSSRNRPEHGVPGFAAPDGRPDPPAGL